MTTPTANNPAPHNRDGFSKSFYGPMSQPLLEAELDAKRTSTRATALRTEAAAIDTELAELNKTDREALLAFAVRQCSTLSECFEPSEVEAMSTRSIRAHLELEFDRHAESLYNRANYLDEAGE